jgi:hypothetical protein
VAERVLDEEFTYDDGSRIVVIAYRVPESDQYPSGIKYRFQYMTADGTTLLRYDNAPHHEAGNHHEHRGENDVEAVEFDSIADHYQQFRKKVEEIYEQRNT